MRPRWFVGSSNDRSHAARIYSVASTAILSLIMIVQNTIFGRGSILLLDNILVNQSITPIHLERCPTVANIGDLTCMVNWCIRWNQSQESGKVRALLRLQELRVAGQKSIYVLMVDTYETQRRQARRNYRVELTMEYNPWLQHIIMECAPTTCPMLFKWVLDRRYSFRWAGTTAARVPARSSDYQILDFNRPIDGEPPQEMQPDMQPCHSLILTRRMEETSAHLHHEHALFQQIQQENLATSTKIKTKRSPEELLLRKQRRRDTREQKRAAALRRANEEARIAAQLRVEEAEERRKIAEQQQLENEAVQQKMIEQQRANVMLQQRLQHHHDTEIRERATALREANDAQRQKIAELQRANEVARQDIAERQMANEEARQSIAERQRANGMVQQMLERHQRDSAGTSRTKLRRQRRRGRTYNSTVPGAPPSPQATAPPALDTAPPSPSPGLPLAHSPTAQPLPPPPPLPPAPRLPIVTWPRLSSTIPAVPYEEGEPGFDPDDSDDGPA